MHSNMLKYIALLFGFIGVPCFTLSAQETTELRDTIKASRKISDRLGRTTGTRLIKPADLHTIVSATGESDVIKYIQTLPGISTGGEGSSAFYVRGGNIGNNLITLDNVPIYGSSHLLGFTSVYSPDYISDAQFMVGGFSSEEGNLTASHIKLSSVSPDFHKMHWNASASNFILGGSVSTPIIQDKISVFATLRISPIGAEYSMLKGILTSGAKSISDASAIVYDVYGKILWKANKNHKLALSVFHSLDAYKYLYDKNSDEHMRWDNLIVNLKHEIQTNGPWTIYNGLSYNRFTSRQAAIKKLSETNNILAIGSSINEFTFQSLAKRSDGHTELQAGLKSRYARFMPGSSPLVSGGLFMHQETPASGKTYSSITNTIHAQFSYMKDTHEFRAGAKANIYFADSDRVKGWKTRFNPEFSMLTRIGITNWFGFEATADWTTQYYHTLEGVPIGWSLDMIIPSDSECIPETARQFYLGLFFPLGKHKLSIGGYHKTMNNLVYFTDASQLFSSSIAGWKDNIDVGKGSSKGLEILYEINGDRLEGRIAYTLSKTDRTFPNMNKGESFPAKFDRTHIINATASYTILHDEIKEIGINTLFTYQSGHWETVAAGSFYGYMLHGEEQLEVDWFSHTHNYRMPAYMRLDAGIFFKWNKPSHTSVLTVGIYNMLNRHNPFTVSYDTENREWNQISLLPIMPSISYKISF